MLDTDGLVNKTIIDAAAAEHAASGERLEAAKREFADAERKAASARDAYLRAVEGVASSGSMKRPVDLEQAQRDAEAHVTFMQNLVATLQRKASEAARAHEESHALANVDVLRAGAKERVAAAADFDAALAAMRAAVTRSEGANAVIRKAMSAGCKLPFDGSKLAPITHAHPQYQPVEFRQCLRSVPEETALWGGIL
jgi:hypothetical protein